jgi:arginase
MNRFLLTPFFLDRPEPSLARLGQTGWAINEPLLPEGTLLSRLAAVNEPIAAFAERSMREGDRPVSIAGDCCAVIGVITGLQRAGVQPRLLWLDAHGDFNTPATTPSGFVGGMPLAMLAGRGDQAILEQLRTRRLDEKSIVLCDGRDLDPLERDALSSSRVIRVEPAQLNTCDFGSDPVHVHIDSDILNPADAPAVLYPAAGGPRMDELEAAMRAFVAQTRVVSVSLTTWALDRDPTRATEQSVWRALEATLGAEGTFAS